MEGLQGEIQEFLNQGNELHDFEWHYEVDCPLCEEDGFDTCQGHVYSDETGYLD